MRPRTSTILIALSVAVAALQLWLAHRYFGFLTGDDVEILSEAFRVGAGFHSRPWEVRNLFIPQCVVAPVVWLATKLGVHDVAARIVIATLPFIAAHVATIWLVYRLALKWGGNPIIAALLYALHWIPLAFGSTVYPRTIATLCIVAAAVLVCHAERERGAWAVGRRMDASKEPQGAAPPPRSLAPASNDTTVTPSESEGSGCAGGAKMPLPRAARSSRPLAPAQGDSTHAFLAGLLVGVAFADRFSEIVFLIPLLLIARRRAMLLAGAAVSIALTCGVYDWISWGAPFSSLRNFAELTLVKADFASRIKYQSPLWYLETLPRWCALTLLPLLWRARRHWQFIVIPLVLLSLIPHKELRYLQGIVPFLAVAAAVGFTNRRVPIALVAVSILWNAYGVKVLAKKSMPAVMAARTIAEHPNIRTVGVSQIWAYGGQLYFGDRNLIELGTPPRTLDVPADAIAVYATDVNVPRPWRTFRDGPARAVVVIIPNASDTSDRARR